MQQIKIEARPPTNRDNRNQLCFAWLHSIQIVWWSPRPLPHTHVHFMVIAAALCTSFHSITVLRSPKTPTRAACLSQPFLILQQRLPAPAPRRPHRGDGAPAASPQGPCRPAYTALSPVVAAVEPVDVEDGGTNDHDGEEDAELL